MGFHGLGVESELSHSDKDLAKDGGCLCVFLLLGTRKAALSPGHQRSCMAM